MSVITEIEPTGPAGPAGPAAVTRHAPANPHEKVTFPRVVLSEWIKFRTLRSSWIVLLSAVVVMIAIGALIGYRTGTRWSELAPEDTAPSGPLQGLFLGQLLIGVLGVLFVSGEYTTGMIRSTLAAVPRRVPVLGAKALVYGGVVLAALVPASFVTFFVAQRFLSHDGHGTALSDPTVLRVIIATGVYLALIGLLGSALGWIVRSTPGGISVLVGILLVVPGLLGVLPGAWVQTAAEYLPGAAGGSFYSSVQASDALTPWTGFVVLVIWVIASLGLAAVLLKRRDG